MSPTDNGRTFRLPLWLREYSLSVGILCFVIAIVLYQNRVALTSFLLIGFAFLVLSMMGALSGPPGRRETG